MKAKLALLLLVLAALLPLMLAGCWIDHIKWPPPPPPTTTTTTTTTTTPPPPPPPPPPPVAGCPAAVPLAKRVFNINVMWGHVQNVTPRVNDCAYCSAVTGQPGVCTCKANPEGSNLHACDVAFLQGYECPRWFYRDKATGQTGRLWHDAYNEGAPMSADHFERVPEYEDYTGPCESLIGVGQHGEPVHIPVQGFMTVSHGDGWVKACTADGFCTAEQRVDY